jgi:putative solute:sodium symporter small subunit
MTSNTSTTSDHAAYWRKNITMVLILLFIWAIPSFVCGIIFVEPLNKISLGGYPLGFWFAQQGSIYIFIIIIFVYAKFMEKLDREYGVKHPEEQEGGDA